ncbi:MAG: hypothetical protein ABIL11_02335, partial [Chloroflexota bacterium]
MTSKQCSVSSKSGTWISRFLATFGLCAVVLAACSPTSPTAQPANQATTQLPNYLTTQPPNSPTSQPPKHPTTQPPNPTPTIPRTPPVLPAGFTTSLLNPLDTPHTYITDTCQYLK